MKKYYAIIGMEKELWTGKEQEFVCIYKTKKERDAELKFTIESPNKRYWDIRPVTLVEEK